MIGRGTLLLLLSIWISFSLSSEPKSVPEPEPTLANGGRISPTVGTCEPLLSDFPMAAEHHRICSKMLSVGKFIDWQQERDLCKRSKDIYETFHDNNCSDAWCRSVASEVTQWDKEYVAAKCNTIIKGENDQLCKNIEICMKTARNLNCQVQPSHPGDLNTLIDLRSKNDQY